MLDKVAGYEGKDINGQAVVVMRTYNRWNETTGYAVMVRDTYTSLGRVIRTWKFMVKNLIKAAAVEAFNKAT